MDRSGNPDGAKARRFYGPLSAYGLAIILGITAIDQTAKILAEAYLPFGRAVPILPILALYLTYNEGIAFSLLEGAGPLALIAVTGTISLIVLWLWHRGKETGKWAAAGYALIVGGAVGNLIDRIAYGHVVDYLLLHVGEWTLFVFNLADAALTLGPACLIIGMMMPENRASSSSGR